jgi:hypothetical protein
LAFNSSAEAVRGSLDCEFEAKRIAYQRYSDGTFNHGIYYANIGGADILIIFCHGNVSGGKYEIFLNGQFRTDYSRAISELITQYNNRGSFRGINNVDLVMLGTCHAGYATNIILPNYVKLPSYNIPMCTVIDYKGTLYFYERSFGGDLVSLRIYTDRTYREPASRHSRAVSDFFGGSNVRGSKGAYRSTGGEETEIPSGAIKLSCN